MYYCEDCNKPGTRQISWNGCTHCGGSECGDTPHFYWLCEDCYMSDDFLNKLSKPESPFSDSAIASTMNKIDPPDDGGEFVASVSKGESGEGVDIEVLGEGAIVSNEKVTWTGGGWFKRSWNGSMDWAGLTRLKWK